MAQATTWNNRIIATGEERPDKLLANPRNFRMHPKHQQDALAGVLDEVGWVDDVIVNRTTGHIIDGHLRVSLALKRGERAVPVKYVELSGAEEALVLATFDPISALAAQDDALLRDLLEDVQTDNDAILSMLADMTGEDVTLTEGLTDPDAVPEPPSEPTTKPGDLWRLGRHRLLCGDSTVVTDVERLMGGDKADMVFTDPPYGIDFQSNFREKTPQFAKLANDATVLDIGPVLWAVMADSSVAYVCTRWDVYPRWMAQLAAFEVKNCVVWFKRGGGLGDLVHAYAPNHEFIIVAHKGSVELQDKRHPDVWEIARDSFNAYEHPTQKPVELAAFAIRNHSVDGAMVLDLFGGSGSTLIACEETGRQCRMMEIDPKYCDVIVRRWEDFTGLHAELVGG